VTLIDFDDNIKLGIVKSLYGNVKHIGPNTYPGIFPLIKVFYRFQY